MSSVWMDESKPDVQDAILSSAMFSNAKLCLLGGITAIDAGDSFATIIAYEVNFTGYARQPVSGWSPAVMSGHDALSASAACLFLNTGVVNSPSIDGWAVINETDGKLIWSDLYTTPFVIGPGAPYSTSLLDLFSGKANVKP